MSIQELLTYVEELSFKTSMIGYDKDEVDIQLDKICDEIEAIVKEKDEEIALLKSGAPVSPAWVESPDREEPAAEEADVESAADSEKEEPEKTGHASQYNDATMELEDLRDQIAELSRKLQEAEKKVIEAEVKVEKAEQRAVEAENQAEAAEAKLTSLEDEIRAYKEKGAEENPAAEVKAASENTPQTTDEAYQLYMKNADLLCRQLAAMDTQKESVVAQARQEADQLLSDAKAEEANILESARAKADQNLESARTESEKILADAKAEADRISTEADDKIKEAEEEARRILEDGQMQLKEDQENYEKLLEKKKSLVEFMKDIRTDISGLIDKVQDSEGEE